MGDRHEEELSLRAEELQIEWARLAEQCKEKVSRVFSSDDFLVLGLLDEIVLYHVWPRIWRDFKHVARTSVLLDPVKEIMNNLIHLSQVSKQWRCLVTNSAYW